MSQEVTLMEEAIRFGTTLLAAGAGAWLSIRFFPLKAKQDEWLWSKKIEAQEFVFNTLSEIAFVIHNYLKSEYVDEYSMSGKNLRDTEEIAFGGVKRLHERAAGLTFLLTEAQNKYLDEFLVESQKVLDEAAQTWGQWNQGDDNAEWAHSNATLSKLGPVAESALDNLKRTIVSVYK